MWSVGMVGMVGVGLDDPTASQGTQLGCGSEGKHEDWLLFGEGES